MDDLLAIPLEGISTEVLEAALATAGDETDRWEAKGRELRPTGIAKAVAGLANTDGGLLLLGVERSADGWEATGATAPGGAELGVWITNVISSHLSPRPTFKARMVVVERGGTVALVRVEPFPGLVATKDGRIYRRSHGVTEPVTDGAEVLRLGAERAAIAPSHVPEPTPDMTPEELAAAVKEAARSGRGPELKALLVNLRNEVERVVDFRSSVDLGLALDRLISVVAVLARISPESRETYDGIRAIHAVFDSGSRPKPGPVPTHLDLFRALLPRVQSFGALLVRLELWRLLKVLAERPAPPAVRQIYPGWITYMEAQLSRALNRPPNIEHYRHALRTARACGEALPALRPDGADEHAILDSVLVADFLLHLVEIAASRRQGGTVETYPSFFAFDSSEVLRPVVRRLIEGSELSRDLIARTTRDIAWLVAVLDDRARDSSNNHGHSWPGLGEGEIAEMLRSFR